VSDNVQLLSALTIGQFWKASLLNSRQSLRHPGGTVDDAKLLPWSGFGSIELSGFPTLHGSRQAQAALIGLGIPTA
jgi:hypothetical protein